jgi:hypothetical protein
MGFWELRQRGELPYQSSLLLCGFTTGVVYGGLSSEILIFLLSIATLPTGGIEGMLFLWTIGQFIGVIPAAFIGLVFGLIMAFVFQTIRLDFSVPMGLLLGLGVATLLALIGLTLIAWLQSSLLLLVLWAWDAYWLTLPTVVLYLISGGLCGAELAICKRLILARESD